MGQRAEAAQAWQDKEGAKQMSEGWVEERSFFVPFSERTQQ